MRIIAAPVFGADEEALVGGSAKRPIGIKPRDFDAAQPGDRVPLGRIAAQSLRPGTLWVDRPAPTPVLALKSVREGGLSAAKPPLSRDFNRRASGKAAFDAEFSLSLMRMGRMAKRPYKSHCFKLQLHAFAGF
jgi:hypothetical protein